MQRPIITLTSDFGVQSQGIGNMEGVILSIAPEANVIHLMHGLPDFDIQSGARTMETVRYMPVGYHVCVVDPGVGTSRKPLIIKVKRGDYLIGPDNGVLMAAVPLLGGAEKVVYVTNPKFMIQPISPIFHGRHIFAPAAAHLAMGVVIEEFGPAIPFAELVRSPYAEATVVNGTIDAEIICINKYGSLHLNILTEAWNEFGCTWGDRVALMFAKKTLQATFAETFGQVPVGAPLIMKDDYGRVEIALNQGNFAKQYDIAVGDHCQIRKE